MTSAPPPPPSSMPGDTYQFVWRAGGGGGEAPLISIQHHPISRNFRTSHWPQHNLFEVPPTPPTWYVSRSWLSGLSPLLLLLPLPCLLPLPFPLPISLPLLLLLLLLQGLRSPEGTRAVRFSVLAKLTARTPCSGRNVPPKHRGPSKPSRTAFFFSEGLSNPPPASMTRLL